jgi:hypothetical protein
VKTARQDLKGQSRDIYATFFHESRDLGQESGRYWILKISKGSANVLLNFKFVTWLMQKYIQLAL